MTSLHHTLCSWVYEALVAGAMVVKIKHMKDIIEDTSDEEINQASYVFLGVADVRTRAHENKHVERKGKD